MVARNVNTNLMRLAACDFCVWIGFDNDGNLELLSWLGILWLPRFPPPPCLSVWCVPDPRHQFWQSLTRILTRNFHFNWPWCLLTAVHWSQTRGVDMWSVHTFSNDFANSHIISTASAKWQASEWSTSPELSSLMEWIWAWQLSVHGNGHSVNLHLSKGYRGLLHSIRLHTSVSAIV